MTMIALAQINPTLGDIARNAEKIRSAGLKAREKNADVIVFPKGALSGMPVLDLAEDKDFLDKGAAVLRELIDEFNGMAFFDECFFPVPRPTVDPKLHISCIASPYCRYGLDEAWKAASAKAKAGAVWLAECNLVGGQDEFVYAGGSFVVDPGGVIHAAAAFKEDLFFFNTGMETPDSSPVKRYSERFKINVESALSRRVANTRILYKGIAEVYRALVLAIHDYVEKNRLNGAAVSVSGGIDSAVVAALAVDALGPGRVKFVTLPGPYTSAETLADAKALAANLGVPILETSIVRTYDTARTALAGVLADGPDDPEDISGQNLQARIRGMFVMALANRNGLVALNCSNKTELMVGYGTLYGDLCGGFSPLKDIWKTDVWELARQTNEIAGKEVIPQSIIDRVPSAELRENQEDRQSLPDYPVLDAILEKYLDQRQPYSELNKKIYRDEDLRKAIGMNFSSAFKRLQAPLGPIIGSAPRSLPTTNRFRPWL